MLKCPVCDSYCIVNSGVGEYEYRRSIKCSNCLFSTSPKDTLEEAIARYKFLEALINNNVKETIECYVRGEKLKPFIGELLNTCKCI